MIHKIKALHNNGEGLSSRKIAQALNISRTTVRKYLRLSEPVITLAQTHRDRSKFLDTYAVYIEHQLSHAPSLSAVKLKRRLVQKFGELDVSERSLRRYVARVKKRITVAQTRYYEPVLDMVPGAQCQVDPGELRQVMIGGVARTVYFVVFVLSYSRLMHVSCSLSPIDTTTFIRMHDAAFRYFGGCPDEVVYDQTKLVVLSEKYRELELNPRMAQYATRAGYRIRACEGFDPESKGKVEAGVKYVKQNAFYDEQFADESALHAYVAQWLEDVANVRVHGSTGRQPIELYESDERSKMSPYLSPSDVHSSGQALTRQVDKTGLISYLSNKYSVPMVWQRQTVAVKEEHGQLLIFSPDQQHLLATHALCVHKGVTVKSKQHYRDSLATRTQLEGQLTQCLGTDFGTRLAQLLKQSSPKIYPDQLRACISLFNRWGVPDHGFLTRLCALTRLTAKGLEERLEVSHLSAKEHVPLDVSISTGALNRYRELTQYGAHHERY